MHYGLFVLGFAANFVPANFFETYAVDMSNEIVINEMFENQLEYFDHVRNPNNGLWCDSMGATPTDWHCGDYASESFENAFWGAKQYHGGACSWGMIADAGRVEIGEMTLADGYARTLQVNFRIINGQWDSFKHFRLFKLLILSGHEIQHMDSIVR